MDVVFVVSFLLFCSDRVLLFLLTLLTGRRGICSLHEISRSPHLAHKAPVMQAREFHSPTVKITIQIQHFAENWLLWQTNPEGNFIEQ